MLFFACFQAIYLWFSAVKGLKKLNWYWRGVLAVPIVLAAFKFHLLYAVFGGGFFAPECSRIVLLLAAWYYAAGFLFFWLLLTADLIRGAGWLIRRGNLMKSAWRNWINGGLLLIAMLLAACGVYNALAMPQLKYEKCYIENLPESLNGFKFALLADLHVDNLTLDGEVAKVVAVVNNARPDMVLLAGDLVDGQVAARSNDLLPLSNLQTKYGVYSAPGNHEYYSGYEEWTAKLAEWGIPTLANERVYFPALNLAVAGVTDQGGHRRNGVLPDPAAALADLPVGTIKIIIAHRPELAEKCREAGADIQVSGHTHGGMIWIMNKVVAAFNQGYVSGWYNVGKMQLYVSSGTGIWSGFPVRLGVPAEITIIELVEKNQKK